MRSDMKKVDDKVRKYSCEDLFLEHNIVDLAGEKAFQ